MSAAWHEAVKIDIGNGQRTYSSATTAASCFTAQPGAPLLRGKPAMPVKAWLGSSDLATAQVRRSSTPPGPRAAGPGPARNLHSGAPVLTVAATDTPAFEQAAHGHGLGPHGHGGLLAAPGTPTSCSARSVRPT